MTRTILFLCPHGAAKSIMAAAYFEQLAARFDLGLRADTAGTEPDAAVSPAVAQLLSEEGLGGHADRIPRLVTAEALSRALRVISLGCNASHLAPPGLVIERWDDVPPPSQNLPAARDLIRGHVEQLVNELRQTLA